MARPQGQGWVWNSERAQFLAECAVTKVSCSTIAQIFNDHFRVEFPNLAFNKHDILRAVKSRTVRELWEAEYGKEKTQALIDAVRTPRLTGRPKGAKDRKPRKNARLPQPQGNLHSKAQGTIGMSRPR